MPPPSPQADRPVCPPPAGPACPTRTPITSLRRPVCPPPARPARHDLGTAAAEPGPPGTARPASPPKPAGQIGWRVLVALGLLVPWWFNLRYFADGGSVLPQVFFRDAMANALTTAITLDVYLAAVAFSAWVLGERRVRWPWLIVVACFGVGLSFALPLYLLLRRRCAA